MLEDKDHGFLLGSHLVADGGARVVSHAFACSDGCDEYGTVELWRDHTRFIPLEDGSNGRIPNGVCQLVSTQIEILICRPPGRIPTPGSPCHDVARDVATFQIAEIGSDELTCGMSKFKPFHRSGKEGDKHYPSGGVFRPGGTPPDLSWVLHSGFTSNFDLANLTLTGLPGVTAQAGLAIGQLPVVEIVTTYDVTITASNRNGDDSVTFKVSVHP